MAFLYIKLSEKQSLPCKLLSFKSLSGCFEYIKHFLTHFKPIIPFRTPKTHHETPGFLMFLEGKFIVHCIIGSRYKLELYNKRIAIVHIPYKKVPVLQRELNVKQNVTCFSEKRLLWKRVFFLNIRLGIWERYFKFLKPFLFALYSHPSWHLHAQRENMKYVKNVQSQQQRHQNDACFYC